MGDIHQLTVHVVPQNEVLGNLNNYSCEQLKARVKYLIRFIRKYGIHLSESAAAINYFELNRNYFFDNPAIGLSSNPFVEFMEAAFATLKNNFTVLPKMAPWGTLGVVDTVGVFANASTVRIHAYNKTLETEDFAEDKNIFLYVENPMIYRLEFVVTKKKQVESWLGTSNVFELEQKSVEEAYATYLKKYVLNNYPQQFNRLYDLMIGVENPVDTSNRHWTDQFARDLLFFANQLNIDHRFITKNDVRNMLKYLDHPTKTVSQNLSRYIKKIVEKTDNKISDVDYAQIIKDLLVKPTENYRVHYYTDY